MNKIKKIIFDLVGIGFAIIAVFTGVFILEGETISHKGICSTEEILKILKSHDAALSYYLAISGIAVGGVTIIIGVILIILSINDKPSTILSILVWSMAIVALGLVLYSLIKFSDDSFIKEIMDNLK